MDNTYDKFVLPWLEAVKEIAPRQVMIYTIDRETPDHDLQKMCIRDRDAAVLFQQSFQPRIPRVHGMRHPILTYFFR